MAELTAQNLITKTQFDEEIEWTSFYLWHHEGRRAHNMAQSMMAPDYAHWHGMYEVAERFYQQLIPQAREIAEHAAAEGQTDAAEAVLTVIDELLAHPNTLGTKRRRKQLKRKRPNVLSRQHPPRRPSQPRPLNRLLSQPPRRRLTRRLTHQQQTARLRRLELFLFLVVCDRVS